MIIDSYGFPKDNGASDWGDSPRLAAMMALVQHKDQIDLSMYVKQGVVYRHPFEECTNNPRNVTRDQLLPLCVGLAAQGKRHVVEEIIKNSLKFGIFLPNSEHWCQGSVKAIPDFRDILSPSAILAIRLSSLTKPSKLLLLFGNLWIILDIIFASFCKKCETNQLIASIFAINNNLFKFFQFINHNYVYQIENYWCFWRDEKDLANKLIIGVRNGFK